MEPKIGKFPIEVFGRVYTDVSDEAIKERKKQYCPYLGRECTKPRKSEPHIKVGICSVGYKGSFTDSYRPVIICPFRFLEDIVFKSTTYIVDALGEVIKALLLSSSKIISFLHNGTIFFANPPVATTVVFCPNSSSIRSMIPSKAPALL